MSDVLERLLRIADELKPSKTADEIEEIVEELKDKVKKSETASIREKFNAMTDALQKHMTFDRNRKTFNIPEDVAASIDPDEFSNFSSAFSIEFGAQYFVPAEEIKGAMGAQGFDERTIYSQINQLLLSDQQICTPQVTEELFYCFRELYSNAIKGKSDNATIFKRLTEGSMFIGWMSDVGWQPTPGLTGYWHCRNYSRPGKFKDLPESMIKIGDMAMNLLIKKLAER